MAKLRSAVSLAVILAMSILFLASWAWAKPTTPEQARQVVQQWLALDPQPLETPLGDRLKDVRTFTDNTGAPLYHVVFLDPDGIVLVAGDDLVEPIIGFLLGTVYDPSPTNPLGALAGRDIPRRVAYARELERQAMARGEAFQPLKAMEQARRKWLVLEAPDRVAAGLPIISDILVDPLVQSKWGQRNVNGATGATCYNYYTPQNYPCGCNATAMAQVMRFYSYPTTGVGMLPFDITVDGKPETRTLRGGDGFGGPYDWSPSSMPLDPNAGATEPQRQAIGALTYDAGLAVNMGYTAKDSGSIPTKVGPALVNTFKFPNAKVGVWGGNNIPTEYLYNMINPNLDAGYPVILGISRQEGGKEYGHAVVGDGYGYNYGTMYHHLNMGWYGDDNAWYNLPNIDCSPPVYTEVDYCTYNIYKDIPGQSRTGEIISGRVTDLCGAPISGATVTAAGGGKTYQANTNAKGVYALPRVPSATTFTMTCTAPGYSSTPQPVQTGTSADEGISGNLWGINFRVSQGLAWIPKYRLYNLATTGTSSRAFAINNLGAAVGARKINNQGVFNFRATAWLPIQEGKPVAGLDLGTLGGSESEAHGINDDNLIVGWSRVSGSNNEYPCYWDPIFKIISPLKTDNNQAGKALGVNKKGEIVGFSYFGNLQGPLACYWPNISSPSQQLDLISTFYTGQANRISEFSKIVGNGNDGSGISHAVQWDNSGAKVTDLYPGSPGEAYSPPNLNDSRAVGCYKRPDGIKVACLFEKGKAPAELGSLGTKINASVAYGRNSQGVVVGQATNDAGRGRAFVWDARNGMQDLNNLINEPDWLLNTAYDINDRGEIVGWGYYKCVFDFAFLLVPTDKPVTPAIGLLLLQD